VIYLLDGNIDFPLHSGQRLSVYLEKNMISTAQKNVIRKGTWTARIKNILKHYSVTPHWLA
jgi:hypothetical protein